jgi:ATP-binding cassette, subfamily B, bacterial PglK
MISHNITQIFRILNDTRLFKVSRVLTLIVLAAAFELIGIASIMPLVNFMMGETGRVDQVILFFRISPTENQLMNSLTILSVTMVSMSFLIRAISLKTQHRFVAIVESGLSSLILNNYLAEKFPENDTQNSNEKSKLILTEVQQFVSQGVMPTLILFAALFQILFIGILICLINPYLFIFTVLLFTAVYGTFFVGTRTITSRINKTRYHFNTSRFLLLDDAFNAINEIVLRGLEKDIVQRFRETTLAYASALAKAQFLAIFPKILIEFGILISGICVMYFIMSHPDSQYLKPNEFIIILFASIRILPAFQALYFSLSQIRASTLIVPVIASKAKKLVDPRSNEVLLPIVTDNIAIHYLNRASILQKWSVVIGKCNLLIGPSGSGKSTLIKVLMGLMPLKESQIFIDGKQKDQNYIFNSRDNYSYVSQHPYLVDGSVADNLFFGLPRPQTFNKKLEEIYELCGLSDICPLHGAEVHQIGQRGSLISGGQRQRLAIARALIIDKPIIVLDEATSALDATSESTLVSRLINFQEDKTVILITHNMSLKTYSDYYHEVGA